mgnify:CR=1 FL=1
MSDDRTEWRFLVKARPAEGGTVTLDEDQSHRLAEVLRIGEGRTVRIFTGDGEEFEAEVLDADRQGSTVRVLRRVRHGGTPGPELTLGFAPPRGARADWLVEKATELGAARLVPLMCERLERFPPEKAEKRRDRWNRKAEGAARQSERTVIPDISKPVGLRDFAGSCSAAVRLACHTGPKPQDMWSALSELEAAPESAAVAIGPGGGFTDRELALLARAGWSFVSLGPTTLRTETACVVALGCLSVRTAHWTG